MEIRNRRLKITFTVFGVYNAEERRYHILGRGLGHVQFSESSSRVFRHDTTNDQQTRKDNKNDNIKSAVTCR